MSFSTTRQLLRLHILRIERLSLSFFPFSFSFLQGIMQRSKGFLKTIAARSVTQYKLVIACTYTVVAFTELMYPIHAACRTRQKYIVLPLNVEQWKTLGSFTCSLYLPMLPFSRSLFLSLFGLLRGYLSS